MGRDTLKLHHELWCCTLLTLEIFQNSQNVVCSTLEQHTYTSMRKIIAPPRLECFDQKRGGQLFCALR